MFSRNQGKERTLTHRSIRLTAGAPQHLLATLPRRTQIRKTCLVNIKKVAINQLFSTAHEDTPCDARLELLQRIKA